MLYVVGDSNSVYTSEFLIAPRVDRHTLCRVGWTTEDVLTALRRTDNLSDATGFFVFVGLNDRLVSRDLVINVLQIIATLRARRTSTRVPIFVAPPFCVPDATPTAVCNHRRAAAVDLLRELTEDGLGSFVLKPHLTRQMYVPKNMQAHKPNSTALDPLHLNTTGYKQVANAVNRVWTLYTDGPKRTHQPKIVYEAGPAPPPRVAWAEARRKAQRTAQRDGVKKKRASRTTLPRRSARRRG